MCHRMNYWTVGPGWFCNQSEFMDQWDEELFWELSIPLWHSWDTFGYIQFPSWTPEKLYFWDFLGHFLHSIIATITNWYIVLDKYCWIAFQKCCTYIYTVPSLPNWILFLFNLFFWINWDVNCCTSLYKFKVCSIMYFYF